MQKQLHTGQPCAKLDLQGNKIVCPKCGHATQVKILPTTALVDFPIFCKYCKQETIVNMSPSQSQCRQARARASAGCTSGKRNSHYESQNQSQSREARARVSAD